MTPRQRILAPLKGEKVDSVPWSPNLAYGLSVQSPEIQNMCEVKLLQKTAADPMIRGHHPMPQKE